MPAVHVRIIDGLDRSSGRFIQLVQFGDDSETAIVKRVPIRTDRVFAGIAKLAENGRRPAVKFMRLWNEKVAAGLGVVERVDVLPFHQMGRFKWEKLGLD
jgi:hypothetical protein